MSNTNKEIETITIPVVDPKDPKSGRWIVEHHPILYPHRIVSYMMDELGVLVPEQEIRDFWQHVHETGEPAFKGFQQDDCRYRVPLGLYGDSAQLFTQYRKEKLIGIFFNYLNFRPKPTRFARYLLFCIDEAKLLKNKTLNSVLRVLVWSFNALHDGVYPQEGPGNRVLSEHHRKLAGRPISLKHPEYRFSLVELRGDWLWHRDLWSWKCGWKAKNTCFRCDAQSVGPYYNRYYNVKENCMWVSQEFTVEEFISRRLPSSGVCKLVCINNFLEKHKLIGSIYCLLGYSHFFRSAELRTIAGPLMLLRHFSHRMIAWCSMHTINLGLLFACNAGSLNPGLN